MSYGVSSVLAIGKKKVLDGLASGLNTVRAFLMRPAETMAMVILQQIREAGQRTGRRRDGSRSGLGTWLADGGLAGLRRSPDS
jgi:hypothetical protein